MLVAFPQDGGISFSRDFSPLLNAVLSSRDNLCMMYNFRYV